MNRLVNSTVISNFAAVDRLDLLHDPAGPLYLPIEIYHEIQEGQNLGYSFYTGIEQHIHPFNPNGWLHLVTMTEAELLLLPLLPTHLHGGEIACLCIAHQRGWGFLTDDRAARKQAQAWQIPVSGTLGILVLAIQDALLTVEDGNAILQAMIQHAKYRSPVTDLAQLLK